jgi:hypothetical protein
MFNDQEPSNITVYIEDGLLIVWFEKLVKPMCFNIS